MNKEILAQAIEGSFSRFVGGQLQNKLHDDDYVNEKLINDFSPEWFIEASMLGSDAWDYAWSIFWEKNGVQ